MNCCWDQFGKKQKKKKTIKTRWAFPYSLCSTLVLVFLQTWKVTFCGRLVMRTKWSDSCCVPTTTPPSRLICLSILSLLHAHTHAHISKIKQKIKANPQKKSILFLLRRTQVITLFRSVKILSIKSTVKALNQSDRLYTVPSGSDLWCN